jgi:hypothetical protein
MTEYSFPWDGTTVGDCGPYSSATWDDMYHMVYGDGIIAGVGGELAVSGTASPLTVASGAAFVNGKFYRNTASVSVSVPTPTSATRVDRIVLRADYTAQTVRITRLAGTEGSGSPPPLTQSDGVRWEISLAQVTITVGGSITITSEREAITPGRLPGELSIFYVTSVDAQKRPVRDGLAFKHWYLCDGGTYNGRATPNLTDRMPIGVGTIAPSQGATGGSQTKNLEHTHGVGTLANSSESSHTHGHGTLATDTVASHAHQINLTTSVSNVNDPVQYNASSPLLSANATHTHTVSGYTVGAGSHSHAVASGSTGPGSAHTHTISGSTASGGSTSQDIMPPYIGVYWFMYSPA